MTPRISASAPAFGLLRKGYWDCVFACLLDCLFDAFDYLLAAFGMAIMGMGTGTGTGMEICSLMGTDMNTRHEYGI